MKRLDPFVPIFVAVAIFMAAVYSLAINNHNLLLLVFVVSVIAASMILQRR